jgi:ATP-binding cassette subfamily B protein
MAQNKPGAAGSWLFFTALRYPHLVLLVLAAAAAGAYFACALVVTTGDFFSAPGEFSRYALRIALYAFICGAAGLAMNCGAELLAARAERDCRMDYYAGLLSKDFPTHIRFGQKDLLPGVLDAPLAIGRLFCPGLARMIYAFFLGLFSLFMTMGVHPVLLPLPAIFALLLLFSLRGYNWHLEAAVTEERDRRERLAADVEETVSGRETIVSQSLTEDTVNTFNADALFLKDGSIQREKAAAWYLPGLLFWVFLGAGLFEGFFLLWRGALEPGGFAVFTGLFLVFLYAARVCPPAYALVQQGGAAAARMLKIMNRGKSFAEPPTRSSGGETLRGGVSFDAVFFSYESSLILRRISFTVKEGMFVVIAGASGSGKTTLARLAARLLEPDIGTISIDGKDIRDRDRQSVKSQIAFIGQEPFLFPLSVRGNIALGNPAATDEDIRAAAEKTEAHEFISRLSGGYDTPVGDGGEGLTADMSLRIALARAVLADPRILIIDDAAGTQDSKTEDQLCRAVQAAARGRTAFIVSHRLSQIRWADYILFMKNGEILCQGTHEQLVIESADYRRIFSGLS